MQPKADCLNRIYSAKHYKYLSGRTPQSPAVAVKQKRVFTSISWKFAGSPSASPIDFAGLHMVLPIQYVIIVEEHYER
jgi:hypothetical protein